MNCEQLELSNNLVNEEPAHDAFAVELDEGDICFYDDHLHWMGEEKTFIICKNVV